MRQKFSVTGMTCSACSAHVEKSVKAVDGVSKVEVSLLQNTMTVDFDESKIVEEQIIKAVEQGGYGASLLGKSREGIEKRDVTKETLSSMKKRLLVSGGFLLPLMYLSMGHMLGLALPGIFHGRENALVFAFTQLLLTLPVVYVNRVYFTGGLKSLFHGAPNMDTLITIGSGASLIYGIVAVYVIGYALGHDNFSLAESYAMNLYFEGAAMILTLITFGKFLETRAKGKTSDAIRKLMDLSPKTALVEREGQRLTIPVEALLTGDIAIVKTGATVPADGVVVEGLCSVDESAITGESLAVEKSVSDSVTGGTVLKSGFIKIRVEKTGEETVLSQIISLVEAASASKAPIAKTADRISGIFVPLVMTISVITFLVWLFADGDMSRAFTMAVSVLVISCPCALGLATPTAIMVGMGRGAGQGILIKSAESLETAHNINTVVLDKTGTITEGNPQVTELLPQQISEEELLKKAASLEILSEHPLAHAIMEKAGDMPLYEVTDFQQLPGRGLSGVIDGKRVLAGNRRLMEDSGVRIQTEDALSLQGKTVLYVAEDKKLLGLISIFDTIKKESREAVRQLQSMGIRVMMLTGDNRATGEAVGRELGISQVIAEVLPQDKEQAIRTLQAERQKVAMVGDGVNDAPALAQADVGIAIGAGTDIAVESADIVLMQSDLRGVAGAIGLSRRVIRNIHENLFWAFFYNSLGIPLAAGVLYPAFGIGLNPMIASAAMSLSSIFVVGNALRLRFVKEKKEKRKKEATKVEKVMKIQGMMCSHCTGRVQTALNELDGVSALVNLEEGGQAILTLDREIDDALLIETVKNAGYEVTSIQ